MMDLWILQHWRTRSVHCLFSALPPTSTLSGVPIRKITSSYTKSATFSDTPYFCGRATSHRLWYSLATTSRRYLSSVLDIYAIFIPTSCHRWCMVKLFTQSSYCQCALISHCLHNFTKSLTLTYIPSHLYHSITFHNVHSHSWCLLCSYAASIAVLPCSMLTDTIARNSPAFCGW